MTAAILLVVGLAAPIGPMEPTGPMGPTRSMSAAERPPAAAHALLEASTPSAGDTLAAAPPELVLTFSGPVEEARAMLRLLGTGHTWALEAARPEGDPSSLSSPLPRLEPGGYRVEWRVVSADGHAIAGDFTFHVGAPGANLAPPPPTSAGVGLDHDAMAGATHEISGGSYVLIVTRAAVDIALLALAGMLLFAAWGTTTSPLTTTAMRGLAAGAPLLATGYAWVWAGEVLGGGPDVEVRVTGLLSLTSGRSLAAEATLAWLVAWALLLARRPAVAAVFALLAVGVGGLGGHPASYTPSISTPASVIHVVAAAVWLGGLAFLVTERRAPSFDASARRVSNVALAAVPLVAVTGIAQTWLFLPSLGALATSTFGALVLAKVAGLTGLVAFGAYHRSRLLPAVASDGGGASLARSVRRELVLAAAVVVLAAILSHIPPTP